MSLTLTIASLLIGFIVLCKILLAGVRGVIRASDAVEPDVKEAKLGISPVRR